MATDVGDLDPSTRAGRPSPTGSWCDTPAVGVDDAGEGFARSVASWRSFGSVNAALSVASVSSILSFGSVGSAGSILSIGSAGSILSIGSAGSILSIGSAGSILSIGSAGSIRNGSASTGEEGSGGRALGATCTVLAVAALVAAALDR